MNGRGKYSLTTCPRVLNSLFRKGIRTLDEEDKESLLRLFIFFIDYINSFQIYVLLPKLLIRDVR